MRFVHGRGPARTVQAEGSADHENSCRGPKDGNSGTRRPIDETLPDMTGLRGGRDEIGAHASLDRDDARTPNARRYEALGRVMAVLAGEAEMLEACRDLAWWRGSDHSWHIEWRDGPNASEVAALLVERVQEPGFAGSLAGPAGLVTASMATLDVMGVSFVLRVIDPIGMTRLRARPGLWRMSATLDGAVTAGRRVAPRQHWEELLGG